MQSNRLNAPTPDLRIIMTGIVVPHESHDNQRSDPLVERLRHDDFVINPPIVAPMEAGQFVILDGANRCYAFTQLGYPHILVQVADYNSGYLELDTWNHVIGDWSEDEFLGQLWQLPDVEVFTGQDAHAIAHIVMPDGRIYAIRALVDNARERNAALCRVVSTYQHSARLNRTALKQPEDVWPLFPDAVALVVFPRYKPADIIAAARYRAYLPPGISRHIVHGRALRVNYPLAALRDNGIDLHEKNERLKSWMQQKLANRQVRYYAEAVYQFDE